MLSHFLFFFLLSKNSVFMFGCLCFEMVMPLNSFHISIITMIPTLPLFSQYSIHLCLVFNVLLMNRNLVKISNRQDDRIVYLFIFFFLGNDDVWNVHMLTYVRMLFVYHCKQCILITIFLYLAFCTLLCSILCSCWNNRAENQLRNGRIFFFEAVSFLWGLLIHQASSLPFCLMFISIFSRCCSCR